MRSQKELFRATVELQQIDQALAKKARKRGAGERLDRATVFDLVKVLGTASPAEVHAELEGAGYASTPNAVRNHLRRLADDGALDRDDDGKYAVPAIFVGPADDDIPF